MAQNPRISALALAAFLLATPGVGLAQSDDGPSPLDPAPGEQGGDVAEGMDLLGQGIDLLLRGLVDEIGPELQRITPELRNFAEGMGPMLGDLAEMMGDINAYHAPEILPNGDIILRRKTPGELEEISPTEPDEGQIDI